MEHAALVKGLNLCESRGTVKVSRRLASWNRTRGRPKIQLTALSNERRPLRTETQMTLLNSVRRGGGFPGNSPDPRDNWTDTRRHFFSFLLPLSLPIVVYSPAGWPCLSLSPPRFFSLICPSGEDTVRVIDLRRARPAIRDNLPNEIRRVRPEASSATRTVRPAQLPTASARGSSLTVSLVDREVESACCPTLAKRSFLEIALIPSGSRGSRLLSSPCTAAARNPPAFSIPAFLPCHRERSSSAELVNVPSGCAPPLNK